MTFDAPEPYCTGTPSPNSRMIRASRKLLGKNPEPATERRISSPAKTADRADVCQIENEIVDRIAFVFEASGDREAFARVKERKQKAPRRVGVPSFSTRPKLAPG